MNPFAVEEIARLVAEHGVPRRPSGISPAYEWFASNADALQPLSIDQSPRARSWRAVQRIAARYPWGEYAIMRAMDRLFASGEHELTDAQVSDLLREMEKLDERAMLACDDDDAAPAR